MDGERREKSITLEQPVSRGNGILFHQLESPVSTERENAPSTRILLKYFLICFCSLQTLQ